MLQRHPPSPLPVHDSSHRIWLWPATVLGSGLVLTALLATFAWQRNHARDLGRFENAVQRSDQSIQARVDIYIGLLRAGAGVLTANPDATAAEFQTFAESIDTARNYPGVQGIGFARRLSRAEKPAFIAAERARGRAEFDIFPAGERDEYFPIVFLSPMDRRNQQALGYDMFSEPTRRDAMQRARDLGSPAVSRQVVLVQEVDPAKQAGFLIYVPVYHGGTVAESIEARRERIRGFVYSPFRAGDLFAGIFSQETSPRLGFEIFDGPEAQATNALYRSPIAPSRKPLFMRATRLQIADRTWTVVYRTAAGFETGSARTWVVWLSVGGVLVSGLLGFVTLALARSKASSAARSRELFDQREQFRVTLSSIGDGVVATDAAGKVDFINPIAEKLTGWTLSEARGRSLREVFPIVNEDTGMPVPDPVERVLRTGAIVGLANHTVLISRTGTRIPIEDSAAPITGERGTLLGVVLVFHDVTERRRADDALQASEARKDAILRSALDAIITINHESQVLEFNPAAESLFGYARADAVGRSLAELIIPPRFRERHHQGMQRFLSTGEGPVLRRLVELPAMRADGSEFPAEVAILPVVGIHPPLFTAFLRDITERKRAETALRASEERFRATFENAAMGFALVDTEGRFARVNRTVATITGYSAEELIGKTFAEITHPDSREADRAAAARLLAGELTVYATEKRYVRKDGTPVWVFVTVSVLRDDAGNPVNFISTIENIEERKRAKGLLELSEERQRLAVEAANLGTWDYNPLTSAVHCDGRCRELIGVPPEAVMTYRLFVTVLHPADRKRVIRIANATLQPGSDGHCEVEFRIIDQRDKTEKWMRAIGQAYFEAAGASRRAYRFIGTLQDITERKRQEHQARFLEELTLVTQRLVLPEEIMAMTARMLGEHLEVNRCAYAEVEDEAVFVITGDYNRGVSSIVGRWPVAAFGRECTRLMLENKAYVVTDSETDPRVEPTDLPAYRATAIRAVICVPLHKVGKFTAAMAVHQAVPRIWTRQEIALVEMVVSRCWEALERGRTLRSLRESEYRFRFMAESMPQKIFTAQPDGRVDYVNQQWLEFAGRTVGELAGWRWAEIVHPDDRQENLERWRQSTATGELFEIEQRFRRRDGVYRWHLSRAVPMRDAAGHVSIWIGSNTDITEIVEAREALAHRGEELERTVAARTASLRQAVEQMEEFSYSISHDLRSPLRSMQGYAQALLEDYGDKLDATGHEFLKRIINASARMDRLTLDVLAYSKVSRATVQPQRVSLDRLVTDCVAQYVDLPKNAEVVVERPLEDVMGHEALLMQVVSNLIGNAVKFVAPGTAPRVVIRTEKREDHVNLAIEDNGIGIAPAHQDRIWGMFERAHIKGGYEGTGIGLAIVRKAIERMGGEIAVASDGRSGSKFFVRLPAPENGEVTRTHPR